MNDEEKPRAPLCGVQDPEEPQRRCKLRLTPSHAPSPRHAGYRRTDPETGRAWRIFNGESGQDFHARAATAKYFKAARSSARAETKAIAAKWGRWG